MTSCIEPGTLFKPAPWTYGYRYNSGDRRVRYGDVCVVVRVIDGTCVEIEAFGPAGLFRADITAIEEVT